MHIQRSGWLLCGIAERQLERFFSQKWPKCRASAGVLIGPFYSGRVYIDPNADHLMPNIFEKLNLKTAQTIVVIDAPASFEPEIAQLSGIAVHRTLAKMKTVSFALAFVTTQAELDSLSALLANKAEGDAILWFAYPKKTSKKYQCEFNRDAGWDVLGHAGFEAVRMVAIDADWSALRFRRVEFIKSLKRDVSRAKSAVGKARTTLK